MVRSLRFRASRAIGADPTARAALGARAVLSPIHISSHEHPTPDPRPKNRSIQRPGKNFCVLSLRSIKQFAQLPVVIENDAFEVGHLEPLLPAHADLCNNKGAAGGGHAHVLSLAWLLLLCQCTAMRGGAAPVPMCECQYTAMRRGLCVSLSQCTVCGVGVSVWTPSL